MEDQPTIISPINSPNKPQPLFDASSDPSEGRQASDTTKEAFSSKLEEWVASFKCASWPALPGSSKFLKSIPSDCPIPPGQKPKETVTPASWKVLQKSPEEYDRDRVGKYAQYFQGNIVLPIPEISEAWNPALSHLLSLTSKWGDLRSGRKTHLRT